MFLRYCSLLFQIWEWILCTLFHSFLNPHSLSSRLSKQHRNVCIVPPLLFAQKSLSASLISFYCGATRKTSMTLSDPFLSSWFLNPLGKVNNFSVYYIIIIPMDLIIYHVYPIIVVTRVSLLPLFNTLKYFWTYKLNTEIK